VSAFCSMFSQLLKLFPRTEFQALVKRTHTERHARGFTCWGQFVAMPQPLDAGLRERASPLATLPGGVPVKVTHRNHVAHENDRIVDRPNG
jgi:hypothetical protein